MKDVKVLEIKNIPLIKVYKILKERKSDERNHEQKMVWEHVSSHKKITLNNAKKLMEELEKLQIRRLKPEMIIQLIDVLPSSLNELKTMFATSKTNLQEDEIKKIMSVVENYLKK